MAEDDALTDDQIRKQFRYMNGQILAIETLLAFGLPPVQIEGESPSQEWLDRLIDGLRERTEASDDFLDGLRYAMEHVLVNRPQDLARWSFSIETTIESELA